jgi:hypothetical protein
MKKSNIKKLALLGLANGLLLSAPSTALAQSALENHNNSVANQALAAGCKGKGGCGTVASSCGKGKCGAIASKCGANCGAIASKCGANCGAVASKCGANCGAIAAAEEPKKTNLEDPSEYSALDMEDYNANHGNLGYKMMSEGDLLLELNNEGVKQYKSLTPEGQALARELASQRCGKTNSCKGRNACKTETNSCAGKGGCKGTTKCAFSDKNLAVKVAAENMANKRSEALKGSAK